MKRPKAAEGQIVIGYFSCGFESIQRQKLKYGNDLMSVSRRTGKDNSDLFVCSNVKNQSCIYCNFFQEVL